MTFIWLVDEKVVFLHTLQTAQRNMKDKISIIIPIYNAARYLNRCLDNVLRQSYTNWECTLVVDGSKDESGSICDEYANKDPRFTVIHKANQGVSAARNTGIQASTGKWLYFCDADDELMLNGLQTLLDAMTTSKCDIVFGGYVECNEEGEVIDSPRSEVHKTLSREEAILRLYHAKNCNYEGYLWCKLFKAEVVTANNLRFAEDICFNEDRLFVMQYLTCIKNGVIYDSTPVYRYYHHLSSAFWGAEKKWNPRYVTDLRAYVRMYELVCTITTDKYLHILARNGIRSSIRKIRRLMGEHQIKEPLTEQEILLTKKKYLGLGYQVWRLFYKIWKS